MHWARGNFYRQFCYATPTPSASDSFKAFQQLTPCPFEPSAGANGTLYIRSGQVSGSVLNTALSGSLPGPRTVAGEEDFIFGNTGANSVKSDETVWWNRVVNTSNQDTFFANVTAGSVGRQQRPMQSVYSSA